jgi:hypothetical protein
MAAHCCSQCISASQKQTFFISSNHVLYSFPHCFEMQRNNAKDCKTRTKASSENQESATIWDIAAYPPPQLHFILVNNPITVTQKNALADWIEASIPRKHLSVVYISQRGRPSHLSVQARPSSLRAEGTLAPWARTGECDEHRDVEAR